MKEQLFAACLTAAVLMSGSCALAHDMTDMPAATAPPPSEGQVLLARVQALIGTWDAPTGQGVMTDIFKPFALGTAVLGEEWINGKQVTATVFYVVNGELRVDHYCDYLNQPRYTARPGIDPTVIEMEFRDATNLDTHPTHFHSTTWRAVDPTHLIQDWYIRGGKRPVSLAHMEFTKRADPAT